MRRGGRISQAPHTKQEHEGPRSPAASRQCRRWRPLAPCIIFAATTGWSLIRIFVRTLHPEKRLHVDHVAGPHRADLALHDLHTIKQAAVNRPAWPGRVLKRNAAPPERFARYAWLEEKVPLRLRDKAEHSGKRPGQHACLPARKSRDGLYPVRKADLVGSGAVKKIKKRGCKSLCARRGAPSFQKKTKDLFEPRSRRQALRHVRNDDRQSAVETRVRPSFPASASA